MNKKEMSASPSKSLFSFLRTGDSGEIFVPHPNGYVYVFQNHKLIGSINIKEKQVISVSVYYSNNDNEIARLYVIVTNCYKFLIVTRKESAFQVLKTFDHVRQFEIFDFKCVGYPQIKVHYFNSSEIEIWDLSCFKNTSLAAENTAISNFTSFLNQKLQFVRTHADELNEEIFKLNNNFFYNLKKYSLNEFFLIASDNSVKISSTWKNAFKFQIDIVEVWQRSFGNLWIFGTRIQNIGERIITDLQLLLQQKEIKNYTYCLFNLSTTSKWFGFAKSNLVIYPGEEILLVGTFEISSLILEPHIFIECHLIFSKAEKIFKIDTFMLNASQMIISRSKKQFSVDDILSIISSQIETTIVIETESQEVDLIDTILRDKMNFELNKLEKIKFFYCTSNQVGIALEQSKFFPLSWKLHIYTRDYSQLYLLVNAFYDFLPEKTLISLVGN